MESGSNPRTGEINKNVVWGILTAVVVLVLVVPHFIGVYQLRVLRTSAFEFRDDLQNAQTAAVATGAEYIVRPQVNGDTFTLGPAPPAPPPGVEAKPIPAETTITKSLSSGVTFHDVVIHAAHPSENPLDLVAGAEAPADAGALVFHPDNKAPSALVILRRGDYVIDVSIDKDTAEVTVSDPYPLGIDPGR